MALNIGKVKVMEKQSDGIAMDRPGKEGDGDLVAMVFGMNADVHAKEIVKAVNAYDRLVDYVSELLDYAKEGIILWHYGDTLNLEMFMKEIKEL